MKVIADRKLVQVPKDFIEWYLCDLSLSQIRVYLMLISLSDGDSEITMGDVALRLGITKEELFKLLSELSELGLIVTNADGTYFIPESLPKRKDSAKDSCDTMVFSEIEQIKGSTLSSSELSLFMYILDCLSFSDELLLYLCSYCKFMNRFYKSYIKEVALSWHENEIDTPDKAKAFLSKDNDIVYKVFEHLGRTTRPTDAERTFIARWTDKLNVSEELILYACDITSINTDKNRLQYASKIIEQYARLGITNVEDASKLGTSQVKSSASKNGFNDFEQNPVDFDKLEKLLLDN